MHKRLFLLLLTTGTCFAANTGEYAAPELVDQTLAKLQASIAAIPGVGNEDVSWCAELRDANIARSPGKPKYETYLSFTSALAAVDLKNPLANATHYTNFSDVTKVVNPVVDGVKKTAVLSYSVAGRPINHRAANGLLTNSGTLVEVYLKDKKYDFAQPDAMKKTIICVVLSPV